MAHITELQRYTIFSLRKQGCSVNFIALSIDKNQSSIYRELNRNTNLKTGEYDYELAQQKSDKRKQEKPKFCKFTPSMKAKVDSCIKELLSPEQIVGTVLKDGGSFISPEIIYRYIWTNKKKGGNLHSYLRNKGKRYRKRGSEKDSRGQLSDRVSIDKRPKIVENKSRFGDLEIDLIIGKNHKKALLTINDRKTGFAWIRLVESKQAEEIKRMTLMALEEFKPMIHTITSDNGKEFAKHLEISEELDLDFYFAKPYHSWQRGANENYNGLVRQYFPKNYNFTKITHLEVENVQNKLNNRPRKRFCYKTPNEMLSIELDFFAFMS